MNMFTSKCGVFGIVDMFTSRIKGNYLLYVIMQSDDNLFIYSIYRFRGQNHLHGSSSKCEQKCECNLKNSNGKKYPLKNHVWYVVYAIFYILHKSGIEIWKWASWMKKITSTIL